MFFPNNYYPCELPLLQIKCCPRYLLKNVLFTHRSLASRTLGTVLFVLYLGMAPVDGPGIGGPLATAPVPLAVADTTGMPAVGVAMAPVGATVPGLEPPLAPMFKAAIAPELEPIIALASWPAPGLGDPEELLLGPGGVF